MTASPLPIEPSGGPEGELLSQWPRAYRFAAMITRNDQDAADIAQDALMRAWRAMDRYDPGQGSFESWLWRIVLNTARDAGRAAGRRRALWERIRDHQGEATAGVDELALARLADTDLLAAVRRLPKRSRTLLALRFGADLSYREIGVQLGLSEAAALMATRRALSALRRDLDLKEEKR